MFHSDNFFVKLQECRLYNVKFALQAFMRNLLVLRKGRVFIVQKLVIIKTSEEEKFSLVQNVEQKFIENPDKCENRKALSFFAVSLVRQSGAMLNSVESIMRAIKMAQPLIGQY